MSRCFVKHQSRCSCAGIFSDVINISISRLWVKQITLHSVGPHPIVEGLKRKRLEVLRKQEEFCLQTAFTLELQQWILTWVFSLLASLSYTFQTCKLPQLCKPIPQNKSMYTYVYTYTYIYWYLHLNLYLYLYLIYYLYLHSHSVDSVSLKSHD